MNRLHRRRSQALSRPGFEASTHRRLYPVPGQDDQSQAGLSLLVLQKVLDAFLAGTAGAFNP